MGRSWGGFLPQNEIVKLHWAAIEACSAGLTAEAIEKLLAENKDMDTLQGESEEEALPSLTAPPADRK